MANSTLIGALRVNLSLNSAAFTEGISRVNSQLQKTGQKWKKWGANMSLKVTAPIAAAATGLSVAFNTIADGAKELERSAQVANVGFQEFQKFAYAAKTVGIESEKLADIYKDVNDRIGDFVSTGGGPMADFFEQIAPKIGITAEAFRGLSGPQALQLYYDSLVKAGASQEEMTFYLEAMASDVTALIPLLAQGGKGFEELGQKARVISDDEAQSLKNYNLSMQALGEAFKGLTLTLVSSGIVDAITSVVNGVADFVSYLGTLNPAIVKWGVVVAVLAAVLGPLAVLVGVVATAIAAIATPIGLAVAGVVAITAAFGAFWAAIVFFKDDLVKIGDKIFSFIDDVAAAFTSLKVKMKIIGLAIIQGLWDGISKKWQELQVYISGIATGVAEGFKSALGIKSPSRVMMEVGGHIIDGLKMGIDQKSGEAVDSAQSVADQLSQAFEGVGSGIADAIKGVKSWRDVAIDSFRSIAGALGKQALSSLNLSGPIGSIFNGLFAGFFADGGYIPRGQFGVVGENGPELMSGPANITPITKNMLGGGGLNFAPVTNIDARGADKGAIEGLKQTIAMQNKVLEQRVVATLNKVQNRNVRPA